MSDLFNTLEEVKNDIKSAIETKGGVISGGLSTYASSINSIVGGIVIKMPVNTKFMYSTFQYIPQLDTSGYTNMSRMFSNCSSLVSVPALDTHNVTDMSYMFCQCSAITTVPYLDTAAVTDVSGMLSNCSSLVSVPTLDIGNVKYVTAGSNLGMFANCTALTDIGGLIDFGKSIASDILNSTEGTNGGMFYKCRNISRQSCINIFNNLYRVYNLKIAFESAVLNRLQDEDIAIATNKGWTISSY